MADTAGLALQGIKILDLNRYAPGIFGTMLLADLGADVLCVDQPAGLSGRRQEQAGAAPPILIEDTPLSRYSPHNALFRNKRNIVLNLKQEAAREVFNRLAAEADVVAEGFRPGVAARLGADYATLRERNPRLVYCSVSGYGQDGPYRDLVGHDINYISLAGALGLIGDAGGPPVVPLNLLADIVGGGMQAALGIMAALLARQHTGRGQIVDVAMTDGVVSIMTQLISWHFSCAEKPARGRTMLSGVLPQYRVYETMDGKHLSVGANEPWLFANLCRVLGREDCIADLTFDTTGTPRLGEINADFAAIFRTKTRDEWFELLGRNEVCVGKVYALEELAQDPHLRQRQMIVDVAHPELGKVTQAGVSPKLSDTPGSIRSFPPRRGEHTTAVLHGLGYDDEEIARLRAAGAVE